MKISLDNALGVQPQALMLRSQRSALLASNLANAETPDYKARDMDFSAALQRAKGEGARLALKATDKKHIDREAIEPSGNLFYRVPLHASLDGNTVNSEQERVRFAENAVRYQATLTFLGREFSGLKNALRDD